MKLISFSLWGDDPKYTQGAIENAKIAKELFKGWRCRFYIHKDVKSEIGWELTELGAHCIIIYDDDLISSGMLWRFRPLKENIDKFIVRDTDGRLTQREKNCVTDWERSGKEFHIIRDNPMHGTRIMGGMWGATKKFIDRINYKEILDSHDFSSTPNVFGYDQDFLAAKIYPLIKDTACIHDDYNLFKDEIGVRKIPHMREGNHYIGEPTEV